MDNIILIVILCFLFWSVNHYGVKSHKDQEKALSESYSKGFADGVSSVKDSNDE